MTDVYKENVKYNETLLKVFSSIGIVLYFFAIAIFGVHGNLDAVYIMCTFSLYLVFIFLMWKWFFFYLLSNLSDDKSRMTLSYVAGCWAALSIVLFGTFQYIDKDHKSDSDEGLGKSFYKVGYSHPLVVFGIVVDSWWRYTLILVYQVTRSLIGAIMGNFFWPWITNTIRNTESNDIKLKHASCNAVAMYGFSQFCALIFYYVSGVTDVFFALSQIDFLLMRWVVDASVSWASTTFFVTRRLKETQTLGDKSNIGSFRL